MGLCALIDLLYARQVGAAPTLKAVWYVVIFPGLLAGAALARWAGGGTVAMRVRLAAVCGALIGAVSTATNLGVIYWVLPDPAASIAAAMGGRSVLSCFLPAAVWRSFWFALLAVVGCLIAEINPGEISTHQAAPGPPFV